VRGLLTLEEMEAIRLAMARTAVVSKQVYERIEEMKAEDPDMSRQEAFRRLAGEIGKTQGNISASYYREARNRGKGSSIKATAPASARAAGDRSSEIDRLARQLVETAQRIAVLLAEQQQELADERRRIEKAKRAIIDA
jgi:hypothetical protein